MAQISPLLAALQGAQYTPDESPLGIGAMALGQAAPMLYNPYASTGKNAAYTIGAGLLSGILGGLAKREANTKNAELFSAMNAMRSSPNDIEGIVQSNPRLANVGLMMMQDQMDKQAEREAQQAAFQTQLQFEKQKMQELMPIQMQQQLALSQAEAIGKNPYAADDITAAYSKIGNQFGALPQAEGLQQAALPSAQPEMPSTGAILQDALGGGGIETPVPVSPETKVNLQSSINQAPVAEANRFQELLKIYKDPTVAETIFKEERQAKVKDNELFDKELTTLASEIQKNTNQEQEFRSALNKSGNTGGFGPTEFMRGIGLNLEASLLGDPEAEKMLRGRAQLDALGVFEAGKMAALFAGSDSNTDREFYLKTAPSRALRPEQNKEQVDRMGRLNLLDQQTFELLATGKQQGLTLAETQSAIKKLSNVAPLFITDSNGERIVNPVRESLDVSKLDLRNLPKQLSTTQKKNEIAGMPAPSASGEVSGITSMIAQPEIVQEQQVEAPSFGNQVGNFLGNVGDKLSFGYGPQIGGAMEVVGSELLDAVGMGAGRSIGENYQYGKQDTERLLDQSKVQNPKLSAVGGVVGSIANPVNKLKPVQAAYKMSGLAGVGARAGTNVILNAISGEENKTTATGAATTSVVVDSVMAGLGASGRVLSNTLRSTLGINRADLNRAMGSQVIKGKSADQVKEAASGLKRGLQLALDEKPLKVTKALQSDSDVYLHVLDGAQSGIKNRMTQVNELIKQADSKKTAISLVQDGKKQLLAGVKGADKKAYEQAYNKELNDWIQFTKTQGGPSLVNMQKEKIARNLTYDMSQNAPLNNAVNKAIADDLRRTIEKAADGALPQEMAGKIKSLNLETRDLINTSKAVYSKIPGAEQGNTIEDVRKALYTTGGAGLAGGSIVSGIAGVDPTLASGALLGTYLNPVKRAGSMLLEPPLRRASQALATPESRAAIASLQGGPSRELPNFLDRYEVSPTNSALPQEQAPVVMPQPRMQQAQQPSQQNKANMFDMPFEQAVNTRVPTKQNVSALIKQQPPLIQAIISVESAGKHDAVSKAGARGLMQVMPANLKKLGVTDHNDPVQNIKAGVAIIQEEMQRFQDPRLALAAYNAGSPRVNAAIKRAGSRDWYSVAPYLPEETRAYVPKVLSKFKQFTT